MHTFRTVASGLLNALLQVVLLVFPAVLMLALLARSPAPVQTVLDQSGAYEQFVPQILQQNAQAAAEQGNVEVAELLRDPMLQQNITQVFTADDMAVLTGDILDGFYAWLQGKTPSPIIELDLGNKKAGIEQAINRYAVERMSGLPNCNLQQLRALQASELNALNAPCLPPGVSAQSLADKFSGGVLQNTSILATQSIHLHELKDSNGKPMLEMVDWLPDAYQWLMRAPWIIGSLILLLAICVICVHPLHYRGLRNAAFATLVAGIFWIIGTLLYRTLLGATLSVSSGELGQEVGQGIQSVLSSYAYVLIIVTIVYMVLGTTGLLMARRGMRPIAVNQLKTPVR